MAACAGDLAKVQEFIEQGTAIDANDGANWTALVWAVNAGQIEVAEFLINNNSDVNIAYGRQNQSLLHQAAQTDSVELIELLIDKGIDVNVKNRTGQTPLHLACRSGNKEVVELLIDKGADVNAKAQSQNQFITVRKPLYIAVQSGNREIVELLLSKGAEVTAEMLSLAEQRGYTEIVEVLQQHSNVYDVGLTNISAPISCVQGETVSLNVTLENHGEFSGSRDITLVDTINNMEIERQTVAIHSKNLEASEADLTFEGDTTEGRNFAKLHSGDINGDGYTDILAAGPSRYDNNRGRVYLYLGRSEMGKTPDMIFIGEHSGDFYNREDYLSDIPSNHYFADIDLGDYFGEGGCLGDINGDGYHDIIIGAPGYGRFQGRVYVYFGGTQLDNKADLVLNGEPETLGGFGWFMAVGDINSDGYGDLFVGAQWFKNYTGRVYLYYGGPDMDSIADKIFEGENPGTHFGYNISAGGDINNDGFCDVLIGAEHKKEGPDYVEGIGPGSAYLYYGGRDMDTTYDKVFRGELARDRFGNEVEICDVDNDGFSDVIIGAPHSRTGSVYLYWGATDMDEEAD